MKKYIFTELDANGANVKHCESETLDGLAKETGITTSTLHRIKENKTQNKKKGRYTRCSISVCST